MQLQGGAWALFPRQPLLVVRDVDYNLQVLAEGSEVLQQIRDYGIHSFFTGNWKLRLELTNLCKKLGTSGTISKILEKQIQVFIHEYMPNPTTANDACLPNDCGNERF